LGPAEARLRAAERAGRGKAVRAQRRLLEQLRAQQRALERGAATARARADGDAAPPGGAGGGRRRGGGGPSGELDADAVARARGRRRRGEALYSDEEELIAAADGGAEVV
jgi:hypothetical protein